MIFGMDALTVYKTVHFKESTDLLYTALSSELRLNPRKIGVISWDTAVVLCDAILHSRNH
jgi:hypothetical protein